MVLGGSAFNIKAKSLRLGGLLGAGGAGVAGAAYGGHRASVHGRGAAPDRGADHRQPWLVNALCREACFDDKAGRDRSRPIAGQAILEAQEPPDPGARDPPRQPGGQAARGVRAAGDRTDPVRRRPARVDGRGRFLRLRSGLGDAGGGRHAAGRQPDLRRSGAATSELRRPDRLPQRMAWYVGADGALDVGGSWWSARCGAATWSGPSPRGWSRPVPAWTGAGRRRAT